MVATPVCWDHGAAIVIEYAQKLGWLWTVEPIALDQEEATP